MIETREVDKFSNEYIQDLTAFGWQPTQEVSKSHGPWTSHYLIMARDTTMPHYNEYRKLELDYETARMSKKYYSRMEGSTVFLLFLLFIIPGILYVTYKTKQKERIEKNNADCRSQMKEAVSAARNTK